MREKCIRVIHNSTITSHFCYLWSFFHSLIFSLAGELLQLSQSVLSNSGVGGRADVTIPEKSESSSSAANEEPPQPEPLPWSSMVEGNLDYWRKKAEHEGFYSRANTIDKD